MHFDALTLAAVTAELNTAIVGGRVQNVLLPDDRTVGFEIYAQRERRYLLITTAPEAARVHLVAHKLRRGTDATPPMLLLLRKYARGGLLAAARQPDPTERVLIIDFDHPEHGVTHLIVEPQGRHANLIFTNPGHRILDCLVRVPPGQFSQRVVLPARQYAPPPAQTGLSPLTQAGELAHAAVHSEGRLWKALIAQANGISPTQAKEIAHRTTGDANVPAAGVDPNSLKSELDLLWSTIASARWESGLVLEGGAVVGFSPYPVHFRGEWAGTPTISAALEQFYSPKTEAAQPKAIKESDPYAGLRGSVNGLIRQSEKRVQRQLTALAGDAPAPGEPESLRLQAEWLLALSGQITPNQPFLDVPMGDGDPLRIDLDSRYTPVEQAQRMFKRAGKLDRAARFIPGRQAILQGDLAFLDQLRTDLALAQSQPEIAAVQEELRDAGFIRRRRKHDAPRAGKSTSLFLRYLSDDGFPILVGRNARQNEIVTFGEAKADDLWLHVRDMPGAHVVIRSGGRPVSAETLQAAAQLAAFHSRARDERAVAVMVAERRHVNRAPGGRPGLVHVRTSETITVPGEDPKL